MLLVIGRSHALATDGFIAVVAENVTFLTRVVLAGRKYGVTVPVFESGDLVMLGLVVSGHVFSDTITTEFDVTGVTVHQCSIRLTQLTR